MDTFKFMVCPHDTAKNPERWFFLTQYLSTKLEAHIVFDNVLDFHEFHQTFGESDIIYANPQDSVHLVMDQGFTPLVRPEGMYDEVVFIAGEDIENPTLNSLQGKPIGTVTSMLPTKIGLHVLHQQGIEPQEFIGRDSWLAVVNGIIKGELDFAFVYKDTYDDLSPMSKEMFQKFFVSQEKLAFHSINLGSRLADRQSELAELFLGMDGDDTGREVLGKLLISKWLPVSMAEVEAVKKIIEAYN